MGIVIIDGLEGSGIVQKQAKLVRSRGKYFLEINKVRKELPMGAGIIEADILKLVGQEVTAVIAGRNIVAVLGPAIKKRPPWVCYIPVPDLFRQMHKDLQKRILERYVEDGVITDKVAGKLGNVR